MSEDLGDLVPYISTIMIEASQYEITDATGSLFIPVLSLRQVCEKMRKIGISISVARQLLTQGLGFIQDEADSIIDYMLLPVPKLKTSRSSLPVGSHQFDFEKQNAPRKRLRSTAASSKVESHLLTEDKGSAYKQVDPLLILQSLL